MSNPHARRRRLKNHKQLKELEELDPGSEDVFMDNLVGNHYPDRPRDLEDVCLHDFVANYTANGKHKSGHKTYREPQKPRLVNHYTSLTHKRTRTALPSCLNYFEATTSWNAALKLAITLANCSASWTSQDSFNH